MKKIHYLLTIYIFVIDVPNSITHCVFSGIPSRKYSIIRGPVIPQKDCYALTH